MDTGGSEEENRRKERKIGRKPKNAGEASLRQTVHAA